jgi:hypothetical protein
VALDFQDNRADNIPLDSILKVKVETADVSINATGRLDRPGGGFDPWSHGSIFNRTKSSTLDQSGLYIARITLSFTSKKKAEAIVTFTIVDEDENVLAVWTPPPQFSGVKKDMALAKYIIDVLP